MARVDVAHDHEAEGHLDLAGEEVDGQEIEAHDGDAVGERLDDRALPRGTAFGAHGRAATIM